MRGAVMYGPSEVRVEERDEPRLVEATDAIIRVSAACVCGSDLWPYRGIEELAWPAPMGHEYVGIVEEVGAEVETIMPGQFVVGSFWGSDNTCEICRAGYQSACVNRVAMGSLGAQAERLRIPFADGTLVATPELPPASPNVPRGPAVRGNLTRTFPPRRPLPLTDSLLRTCEAAATKVESQGHSVCVKRD